MSDEYDWIKHGDAHQIYNLLSVGISPKLLKVAYSTGMIRKEDLEDGARYEGDCRNATEAVWDASKNKFTYIRTKFGSSYEEDIVYPTDDEGYDIFVPVKKI